MNLKENERFLWEDLNTLLLHSICLVLPVINPFKNEKSTGRLICYCALRAGFYVCYAGISECVVSRKYLLTQSSFTNRY